MSALYLLYFSLVWHFLSLIVFLNNSCQAFDVRYSSSLVRTKLSEPVARLVHGVSETIVFFFRGHHRQIDRYCRMPTPCQFSERQHMCYQARDWFLCPSCLPFSLCFKAQFREAYDVLMRALWITLLKDASAQKHLAETDRFCPSICDGGLLPFRARSSLWCLCRDEANVWQPTAAALTRSNSAKTGCQCD